VPLFDGHGFPRERDYKPHLKFHMKKAILFIYRLISSMLVLVDERSTLGSLESVAVLEVCVVFGAVTSTGILLFWYLSVAIHFIIIHVQFDDGLSISVLKIRATHHKIHNWKW
jgi:hypothetical protein